MSHKNIKHLFLLLTLSMTVGCTGFSGSATTPQPSTVTPMNSQSNSVAPSILPDVDLNLFKDLETLRLAGVYDNSKGIHRYYKFIAPYEDQFAFIFTGTSNNVLKVHCYNENGTHIASLTKNSYVPLQKDQIILVDFELKEDKKFEANIYPRKHKNSLPFESYFDEDPSKIDVERESDYSPLQAAPLNYKKRLGGTYIFDNNPEKIHDEDLNTIRCRDYIEDAGFFTFEHNNGQSDFAYYGYRVRNVDTKDIFITVRNVGFQLDGPGCWLGQDEWIQFYNTEFKYDDSKYSESDRKQFDLYYGYSHEFKPNLYQPITYRLPPNEYIYVMGGTTEDAYQNINVFNTANKQVKGGCSNGACYFEVHGGTAEGTFLFYDSPSNLPSPDAREVAHVQRIQDVDSSGKGTDTSIFMIGSERFSGCIDNQATWYFNDATRPQNLPVKLEIEKSRTSNERTTGEPYTRIPDISTGTEFATNWVTHFNVNWGVPRTVGTDSVCLTTKDPNGKTFTFDQHTFDPSGGNLNIGNWMLDYQDGFTLVNQGNKTRKVSFYLKDNGSTAVILKDNHEIIDATYTITRVNMNQGLNYSYKYTVEIPPHTVKQYTLEYNLLANSAGCMNHWVELE